MSKIKDLTGQTFGRLTVIQRAEDKILKGSGKRVVMWLCQCSCGQIVKVQGSNLRRHVVNSCGCFKREKATNNIKHGYARRQNNHRLYQIWCGMKCRCFNSNHKDYAFYGARGIVVCNEWKKNFISFQEWSISNGYQSTLTLDRIDNNGNYEPSNCRWVSRKRQANNTRQNHFLTLNNETLTLTEWSIRTKIPCSTILARLKRGWNIEETLTTPPRQKRDL